MFEYACSRRNTTGVVFTCGKVNFRINTDNWVNWLGKNTIKSIKKMKSCLVEETEIVQSAQKGAGDNKIEVEWKCG